MNVYLKMFLKVVVKNNIWKPLRKPGMRYSVKFLSGWSANSATKAEIFYLKNNKQDTQGTRDMLHLAALNL